MALSTYSELLAAVANWLHRSDLTATITDFVRLAEEQISADLADCPAMWRRPDAIAVGSGDETFSLPDDAFSLRSVRLVSPDDEVRIVPVIDAIAQTGTPRVCAVRGSDDSGELLVELYPVPDAACAVNVLYSAAVTPLGETQSANFVLSRAPSLYLYGALLQAAPYLVNDKRIPVWQDRYDGALLRFRGQNWGGNAALMTDLPSSYVAGSILTGA